MSVYVDKSSHQFGRMKMCHMIADTPGELRSMALRIGVDLKWFQADASTPHFDVCKSKRALAIAAGAEVLERLAFVHVMRRIRQEWPRAGGGKWML